MTRDLYNKFENIRGMQMPKFIFWLETTKSGTESIIIYEKVNYAYILAHQTDIIPNLQTNTKLDL